jgi:hypothetical protein
MQPGGICSAREHAAGLLSVLLLLRSLAPEISSALCLLCFVCAQYVRDVGGGGGGGKLLLVSVEFSVP